MSAASTFPTERRAVPKRIWKLQRHERFRWARTSAGFSHDRLVAELGRSNRGHLIKIEKGDHAPRKDLRDAIADATNVPRELFDDEDDEDSRMGLDDFLRFRVRQVLLEEAASLEKTEPTASLAKATVGSELHGG